MFRTTTTTMGMDKIVQREYVYEKEQRTQFNIGPGKNKAEGKKKYHG